MLCISPVSQYPVSIALGALSLVLSFDVPLLRLRLSPAFEKKRKKTRSTTTATDMNI